MQRYGNLDNAPWIADSSRADPALLSNLNPNSNILDLGCAYGVVSFAISPLCNSVISLDSNKDHVEFVRIRAQQERVPNITSVLADFTTIPFRKNSFDLIILNQGIPSSIIKKHATSFLKQLYLLLKPEGEIYVGVDRYKYRSKSISISCHKLTKNLQSIGFTVTKVLIPLKTYNNFKFLVDYKLTSPFSFLLEFIIQEYTSKHFSEKFFRNILKITNLTGINKLLFMSLNFHSYIIFARKS